NVERRHEMLSSAASSCNTELPVTKWDCVMEHYARFVGDWSEVHENYTWKPLPGAQRERLDPNSVANCRAVLALIRSMAAGQTTGTAHARKKKVVASSTQKCQFCSEDIEEGSARCGFCGKKQTDPAESSTLPTSSNERIGQGKRGYIR